MARTKKATNGGSKFLISVVLDRTGSMMGCRDQTIVGFNNFLHDQQADPNGEAWLSLTLFDKPIDVDIEKRFVATPIKEVPDLGTSANPYEPRGGTPLYDAVGVTIRATELVASKYDKTLLVVVTDGEENSSREWTRDKIFDLITEKRVAGWAFVFMGADQDAYAASQAIGIAAASTMSYASGQAVNAFQTTSGSTRAYRSSGGTTGDSFYGANPAPATSHDHGNLPVEPASVGTSSDDPNQWRQK